MQDCVYAGHLETGITTRTVRANGVRRHSINNSRFPHLPDDITRLDMAKGLDELVDCFIIITLQIKMVSILLMNGGNGLFIHPFRSSKADGK